MMTEEQIQEAARALCVLRGQDPSQSSLFVENEIRRAEQVRAAIEAGKIVTAAKQAKARQEQKQG